MICVVDDDISVLCSLQEVLASDGLEAQAFDDPEKFVDYARTHTVKLAVLDYAMPVLNGLQPQDRLRVQSSDTRAPSLRAGTSRQFEPLHRKAAPLFLSKPFDDETFLNAVNSALDP